MSVNSLSPISPAASRLACRGYRCRSARQSPRRNLYGQDKNVSGHARRRSSWIPLSLRVTLSMGGFTEIDKTHIGLIEDLEEVFLFK